MGQPKSTANNPSAPLSNEQILASGAHRLLNMERVRLLQEAASQREKHPAQAELTMKRADCLKVAMRLFARLQKAHAAEVSSALESTARHENSCPR
jgi:hypothetical protein